MYIKNRIFIINVNHEKHITSFENVNKIISNVFNLRALNCKIYTHIFKIIMRHKLDDKSWKSIFVEYDDNNQWKIYNSITRKMHFTRNVKFDENYNYYDENFDSSFDVEELVNFDFVIKKMWNSIDDEKLNIKRRHAKKKNATSLTSKFMTFAENSNADENFNVDEDIFDDEFHDSFIDATDLFDDSMFQDSMFVFKQSNAFKTKINDINFSEKKKKNNERDNSTSTSNTATSTSFAFFVNFAFSAFQRRIRQSTSSSSFFDKKTRIQIEKLDRINYKKLNIKKSTNIVNNVYHVKQMSKCHIHIIRALHALQIEKNFDLNHIFESIDYKKIKTSFYWSKWKKTMKSEIVFHKKNFTWKLIAKSKNRVVITNRWIFKIKYDIDERILRFKVRWIIHEYKQQHEVDYNET